MPKQITAVEWLLNEFQEAHKDFGGLDNSFLELFKQAKEMEKQQIIEAYENGYSDSDNTFELNKQYYNETFEKSVCPVCKCINGTTCSHSWHLYNK